MDLASRFADIDHLIQKGRSQEAFEKLSHLNAKELERSDLPAYAQLAWRANAPELGIRALAKYVRPDLKTTQDPSTAEVAEYAACLSRIGAHAEAEFLLAPCDPGEYPRVLFYRAALHISKWEYHLAVPILRNFLSNSRITPYERLVARINVAEALVVLGEAIQANYLLRELLHTTNLYQYQYANAKVLELSAQNAIQRGDIEIAQKMLNSAGEMLGEAKNFEPLFISKFKLYARMHANPGEAGLLAELKELLLRAKEIAHYETVRDLEACIAIYNQDDKKFLRVYEGTPYLAFRSKMLSAWPNEAPAPRGILRLGPENGEAKPLSLFGKEEEGKPSLLIQKVFSALLKDLYRPTKVATLYAAIYEGEHYRYESSPLRVRQAVKRARQWLSENCNGLKIERSEDGFFLSADEPIDVYVAPPQPAAENRLEALKENFGQEAFSLQTAGKVLELSPRSVLRLLSEPLDSGEIQKTGSGRQTKYRFCS